MANERMIVRVRVQGRVQGVGYRAFAYMEAVARGVTGWVRNRRNGDVEAVFSGSVESVESLCAICRRGPPQAFVESLEVIPADESALTEVGWVEGFKQLATL